ncbi:hypothetical protein M3147_16475 [Agromyces mediolanus]|uniref:hypothetical protein n=1 Tax=Agromyces mediolanus TaxID=41986 RepID=UPI002040986A|nr:hypothetical protein [Agromyces mediolanus]MCM3658853.1 hypothetical protein [Agromyces mediolanus]
MPLCRTTAAATALVGGLALALTGCAGPGVVACPAVGYLYDGPAVVGFDPALPDGALVSACFGAGCAPAPVERGAEPTVGQTMPGGVWRVPQEAPYLGEGAYGDGNERMLRVVVEAGDGASLVDGEYEIPVVVERTGVFGECPGPFRFETLVVEASAQPIG